MSKTPPDQPQLVAPIMTFGKRIGIAMLVFLAARVLIQIAYAVPALIIVYRLAPGFESVVQIVFGYACAGLVIAGAWLVLLHAQRHVASGTPHWTTSLSEARMIGIIVLLVVLSRIVPHIVWDSSLYDNYAAANRGLQILAQRGFGIAIGIACAYLWVWWCNCPPAVERLVMVAALAWLGFDFLLDLFDLIAPGMYVLISRGAAETGNALPIPGLDAFVTLNGNSWIWRVGAENFVATFASWMINTIVWTTVATVIAIGLYAMLSNKLERPSG